LHSQLVEVSIQKGRDALWRGGDFCSHGEVQKVSRGAGERGERKE
jgi:hypothetical protein